MNFVSKLFDKVIAFQSITASVNLYIRVARFDYGFFLLLVKKEININ